MACHQFMAKLYREICANYQINDFFFCKHAKLFWNDQRWTLSNTHNRLIVKWSRATSTRSQAFTSPICVYVHMYILLFVTFYSLFLFSSKCRHKVTSMEMSNAGERPPFSLSTNIFKCRSAVCLWVQCTQWCVTFNFVHSIQII